MVSRPVPVDEKPLKKNPIGLVYGKDVEFWAVRVRDGGRDVVNQAARD